MARPYVTRRTYQCMSLSVDAAEVVVDDDDDDVVVVVVVVSAAAVSVRPQDA